jgi:hypothetical protein
MSPREVTADHLRAIEKAIGIPCDRWTGLHATSIVAAAVNLADTLKPPVVKPDKPELSDEDASEKFIALCKSKSRETDYRGEYAHLDPDIVAKVTRDQPELAAQHQRWCDGWLLRHRQQPGGRFSR